MRSVDVEQVPRQADITWKCPTCNYVNSYLGNILHPGDNVQCECGEIFNVQEVD